MLPFLSSFSLFLSRSYHTKQKHTQTETSVVCFKILDCYRLLHGKLHMKFHFSLWCGPWFLAQCSESRVLRGEKLPSSAVRNEIQGGGFPTRAATSQRDATTQVLVSYLLILLNIQAICSWGEREETISMKENSCAADFFIDLILCFPENKTLQDHQL